MTDDRTTGGARFSQPSLGLDGNREGVASPGGTARGGAAPPGAAAAKLPASPTSGSRPAGPGLTPSSGAARPASEATPKAEVPENGASARSADARLARLHLRGGLIALARAELEHMAGAGTLDREALVDLAEARWRSGDVDGAAEAAEAHLAAGGTEPIAHVVAAEALDRRGHMIDARGHSALVMERMGRGVERLFAGESRSSAWPSETPGVMDSGASDPGRWGLLVGGREVADPDTRTWVLLEPPDAMHIDIGQGSGIPRNGKSFAARAGAPPGPVLLTPVGPGASLSELVDAGRTEGLELELVGDQIARGELAGVPERLALLLRMDRALAPVILSLADRVIATRAPDASSLSALHLLRGDAYRTLGREADATTAFQEAMRALAGRPTPEEST